MHPDDLIFYVHMQNCSSVQENKMSGCLIAFEGFAGYLFVYPLNLYDITE